MVAAVIISMLMAATLRLITRPRRVKAKRPTAPAPVLTASIRSEQTQPDRIERLLDEHEAKCSAIMEQRQIEKQRKAEADRQQAAADRTFLIGQIDKLYQMLWEADADLTKARKICQQDNDLNAAGAVVADKVVDKHRAARDKLERRVMQLERTIHAYETKLNKADLVLAS